MGKAMAETIVNDTAAFARTIAEARQRNADWAESTVLDSKSVTASEAASETSWTVSSRALM